MSVGAHFFSHHHVVPFFNHFHIFFSHSFSSNRTKPNQTKPNSLSVPSSAILLPLFPSFNLSVTPNNGQFSLPWYVFDLIRFGFFFFLVHFSITSSGFSSNTVLYDLSLHFLLDLIWVCFVFRFCFGIMFWIFLGVYCELFFCFLFCLSLDFSTFCCYACLILNGFSLFLLALLRFEIRLLLIIPWFSFFWFYLSL